MSRSGDTEVEERREHRWAREHLVHLGAGLLDHDAEERLRKHLSRCDACSQIAVGLFRRSGSTEDRWDHIPPRLLIRWEKAPDRLAGMEREMIVAHLKRCESCREDLERIGRADGWRPEADGAPSHEKETHPSEGSVVKSDFQSASSRRPGLSARWAVPAAVWAVAATLLLLLKAPGLLDRSGSAGGAPGSAVPFVAVHAAPSRGASGIPEVRIDPGAKDLDLFVPSPAGIDADREVRIEIRSADGRSILTTRARAGDLDRLVFRLREEVSFSGTYVVRIDPGEGTPPIDRSFRVIPPQ